MSWGQALLVLRNTALDALNQGLDERLVVAVVQLLLPKDVAVTLEDKLDAMVQMGMLVKNGDRDSLPRQH